MGRGGRISATMGLLRRGVARSGHSEIDEIEQGSDAPTTSGASRSPNRLPSGARTRSLFEDSPTAIRRAELAGESSPTVSGAQGGPVPA